MLHNAFYRTENQNCFGLLKSLELKIGKLAVMFLYVSCDVPPTSSPLLPAIPSDICERLSQICRRPNHCRGQTGPSALDPMQTLIHSFKTSVYKTPPVLQFLTFSAHTNFDLLFSFLAFLQSQFTSGLRLSPKKREGLHILLVSLQTPYFHIQTNASGAWNNN